MLLVALCAGTSSACADLVFLTASRDATIYEAFDGSLANGAGRYLFAGKNNQNRARRGLIHFDIAGALPADAIITSARLTMNLSQGAGAASTVSLHRALATWTAGSSNPDDPEGSGTLAGAGDATWLHSSSDGAGGGTLWETAGGDLAAFASATISTQALGLYTWSSLGLLNDVRLFAGDPTRNHGWFLIGDESAAGTARRFDSAEGAAEGGIVPVLEIEFTPVPAPAGVAVLLGAGFARTRRRR